MTTTGKADRKYIQESLTDNDDLSAFIAGILRDIKRDIRLPRVVPPPRIVPAPARDAAHVVPTPVVLAFRAPRQVYIRTLNLVLPNRVLLSSFRN